MFRFSRKHQRTISIILLLILVQSFLPSSLMALTSGPSQPETQQFAPAGMDNSVDPFTGDFSYNIPLMDVGGYPININYAAGITPDAEASWVGLGWNLNVGAITRSMRGLPDDFKGDAVTKEYNVKPNQTFGVTGKMQKEIYGADITDAAGKVVGKKDIGNLSLNASIFYNNYNGFGLSVGASPSLEASAKKAPKLTGRMGINASLGSESGLELSPTVGLSRNSSKNSRENKLDAGISFPFNTREGLKGMTLSGGYSTSKTKELTNEQTKETNKNTNNFGVSSGSFMGFTAPSYMPSIEHNSYNVNASFAINFAETDPVKDCHPVPFGFSGYYSGEFLKEVERTVPAYGYMYSGASPSKDKLMDFNREKDGAFNEFTTNLPLTNYTYDVFNVSGQGVSGTYRLYRGDVGKVYDPESTSKGGDGKLGLEFGAGSAPSGKIGVDASYNQSNTYSGPWQDEKNNSSVQTFANEEEGLNAPNKEMVYFKKVGEMAAETDNNFYQNVQVSKKAIRHNLRGSTKWLGDGRLDGNYVDNDKQQVAIPSANERTDRRGRSTAFTPLLASEAQNANIIPIQDYKMNDFTWDNGDGNYYGADASDASIGYTHTTIGRTEGGRAAHHISEVRVTENAGSRYIYGIPAYNTYQEEVTFAVTPPHDNKPNIVSGLIHYNPGDDSKNNKNGLDHYYNKEITPAYAHSYLLTCILSADYVDRDNIPGPSDGDLGTYTKFNYARAIEKYKWRTPYSKQNNMGSYSQGMLGKDEDDKANYVYGEKEIWYLHSIETRTHVAEFYLKDREDGAGVDNKDGGVGTQKQKYLDKIVLYSKPDKRNSKAEPVKVVHFEYDYSLCPNVPNNTGNAVMVDADNNGSNEKNINAAKGKLTLKKVWFTYGNALKGVLNPYVFNYADQTFDGTTDNTLNPDYGIKNYDRWGNYKKDLANTNDLGASNAEFPYVKQDKADADKNAAVYALSSIQTPTGGTMRVYYESDDYAYVQNKRAMRMFKVLGCSSNGNADSDGNNLLYEGLTSNGTDGFAGQKEYLVVDLGDGFLASSSNPSIVQAEFRDKYLSGIDLMYFKFHTKVLDRAGNNEDFEEFVTGYAELDPNAVTVYGATDSDAPTLFHKAKIKLNRVECGKVFGRANPIVKAGWMYARMNLNRELAGSANAEDGGVEQVLRSILAAIEQIGKLFVGFPTEMAIQGNSKEFTPSRSYVRLNEPDKIKLGGGHRVRAIVMVDNWNQMLASKESGSSPVKQVAFYGQKYDYTYLENGQAISAGVAAYEPIMGGDENPFRLPVAQKTKVPLAPDKEFYLETPFGESFFPAPTVGYRQVVVTPIKITASEISINALPSNGTGYVQHEFFTAYDYPTIALQTGVEIKRHHPNMLLKFMKIDSKDMMTCTQGYSIELNDMHGKQKAQRVYPDMPVGIKSTPISEVEYAYKENTPGNLSNKVTYINPDLSITREGSGMEMGVDVDVVHDERFSLSKTIGGGIQFNLKGFAAGVVPVIVPTAFPDITNEQIRFRSVVTTKVVNRYGILESTTARENGASITTKNLAWDPQTAQVVLTQTQNEFHDPIYNFTYPGHWAYARMDLAAKNEGMFFNSSSHSSVAANLKDGDELALEGYNGVYYVLDTNGSKELYNKSGTNVNWSNYGRAKVIRSGARNMATTPVGSVITLVNPIQSGNTVTFTEVINSGINEYKDYWQRFCNCDENNVSTNPFVIGKKGNLRAFRNWTYLTDRTQSLLNNNINVRKDGVFSDYAPFWTYSNALLRPPSAVTKWQFITQMEKYNPMGMPLEEQDALARFSMSQYGYGRNLQVSTSNNSKYRETGFDGFEDYDFGGCEDDHMSWRQYKTNVTGKQAHTGRKSIKVAPSQTLEINKVIVPCN